MPRLRAPQLLALALAGAALAGCAKESAAPSVPAALTIVQGNLQVRQAGRRLPVPLVFRAIDDAGTGLKGVPIRFVVDQGGGSVDSASVTTDAAGEARVRWTLGMGPTQLLLANVPGLEPVRASATALFPADLVIAQGNNQSVRAGQTLPTPVVVRVLGPGNVPLDSITVSLQVTAGGGAIAPQSIVTNALGEATVRWTMGPIAGPNSALVRAGTLEPAVLTATGTP
ncbi:MAG: hypothetical protein MUF21_06095 [Gemmatimonadaceae bacterium]|nr:hypothetical protein [Gemmatimonadaceae bacterium]